MPKEFKVTKMPYMKFLSKYFRMAANLDEKQEAALFELLAHKMGEPCGKRTVEELLEDVPTKIVFDIICEDIDQSSTKYENMCAAVRENGKKGGRPKKKRPESDEDNTSKLCITNETELNICVILYDAGDSSPFRKLKQKDKVVQLVSYAAIYLTITDNLDYDFIYDCTEKSYSDFIDEMRKMALEAFGGSQAKLERAFETARDYTNLAIEFERQKLKSALDEYNERTEQENLPPDGKM